MVSAAIFAGAATANPQNRQSEAKLTFKLQGTDGKMYGPSDMGFGKPTFLVFLSGSQMLREGIRDIRRLAHLLNYKIRVVGIVTDDLNDAVLLKREYGLDFLLLCDGKDVVEKLGHYEGTEVFTTAIVMPDGSVLSQSPGYSRTTIKKMLSAVSKKTGSKVSVNLSRFPKKLFGGDKIFWGLPPPI
ncbi:MAG: hypothetical protein KF784_10185 [Fimbriimonadaceae bacterium]|nr:hypothetical protein [Fimbriimonadaceae bacterium]